MTTFADLSEMPNESLAPLLDREVIEEAGLTDLQHQWRRDGYVVLPGAISEQICRDYETWRARRNLPDGSTAIPGNYGYMFVPEIRRIALLPTVAAAMRELLGEDLVLQFDLTPWKSTERSWHQDDYLNDPSVNGYYAAVWFAIDDIHPNAGPFQFVPGSHRWPAMRGEKVRALLPPEQSTSEHWALLSQDLVGRCFEEEIAARQCRTETFLARRGDVLIWHSRLVHRGSRPADPSLARRSLIGHYCGISKVRPEYHEVRYLDGVPYVHHRQVAFADYGPETGVRAFDPVT